MFQFFKNNLRRENINNILLNMNYIKIIIHYVCVYPGVHGRGRDV
jgi:hypothetical protein